MKKSTFTLLLLTIGYTNFSLANNPRQIRKDLQEKYAQGLIDKHQLIEANISIQEVLDRNIHIMQEYKNYLETRINGNKGIFKRNVLPFFKGIFTLIAAGLSTSTGIFAVKASALLKDTWEGKDNILIRGTDRLATTGKQWGICTNADIVQYNEAKLQGLRERHPELEHIASMIPIAGTISFLSGLLFIKLAISLYHHNDKLNASIAKWQQKKKNCNAIIGQLKRLRYNSENCA